MNIYTFFNKNYLRNVSLDTCKAVLRKLLKISPQKVHKISFKSVETYTFSEKNLPKCFSGHVESSFDKPAQKKNCSESEKNFLKIRKDQFKNLPIRSPGTRPSGQEERSFDNPAD